MLLHLTTDSAVLLLTVGILLLYLEFNRPGRIVPGTIGLLATLLAAAALSKSHPNAGSILMVSGGLALLGLNLRVKIPPILLAIAVLALTAGFYELPSVGPYHALITVGCGLLLGAGTSVLTVIARHAHASKRLD